MTSRPGYSDAGRHAGKAIPSADISFKQSYIEEKEGKYNVPTSTPFNVCHPKEDTLGNPIDYGLYIVMLHEVGHTPGPVQLGGAIGLLDPDWCRGIRHISPNHPRLSDEL